MEMDCVFCEAQTEFQYLIHINLRIQCVNDLQMTHSTLANSIYKLGSTVTQNAHHKTGFHTMVIALKSWPVDTLLIHNNSVIPYMKHVSEQSNCSVYYIWDI
jgi:hypothetical protein